MQLYETMTAPAPIISEQRRSRPDEPLRDAGKKPVAALIVYSAIFYAVWTLFELKLKPYLNSLDADPVLMQLIKSGVIKNLCWTLPALLLVKKYESDVHIPLKEMFTARFDGRLALGVLGLCTAEQLAVKMIHHGSLEVDTSFTVITMIMFLFVGITEEAVFRGWLLNVMVGRDGGSRSKRTALVISSVMFMLVHFPTWYMSGDLAGNITSGGFLSVVGVGIIFGWLFLHTRNLLLSVMLHMYYDVLISIFK